MQMPTGHGWPDLDVVSAPEFVAQALCGVNNGMIRNIAWEAFWQDLDAEEALAFIVAGVEEVKNDPVDFAGTAERIKMHNEAAVSLPSCSPAEKFRELLELLKAPPPIPRDEDPDDDDDDDDDDDGAGISFHDPST